MGPDPLVAVCGPVSNGPSRVAGAVESPCGACGAAVWVAPSTVALRPDRIVCIPCHGGDQLLARQLGAGQVRLRPVQLPEIEAVAAGLPAGEGAMLRSNVLRVQALCRGQEKAR